MSRVREPAEEALSSVNHRMIEAEEQERQQIAKDLHEDISQRLTLLATEIEQLKAGSASLSKVPAALPMGRVIGPVFRGGAARRWSAAIGLCTGFK